MSALADAIATEVTQREERQGALQEELERIRGELTTIDEQLEALHTMAEQAQNLNGNGAGAGPSQPEPAKRPSSAKTSGDRKLSAGRKGGEAPGSGGRPQSAGRTPGSAPSRSSRTTSGPANGEGGGSKRAAVLAFVQANGKVKIADVAAAVGIGRDAAKAHLKHLREAGQVQAEGATVSRVYFTTGNGDAETAAKGGDRKLNVTPDKLAAVKDLIARNPSDLNEERIAAALNYDRELVANICGRLLEDNEVILAPDATYSIDRGGVAGSVDLKDRIMTALRASDSPSLLSSQLAVQISRDGHGAVSTPDVRDACTELASAGTVTRSGGFGGQHRWSAAE